MHGPEAIGTSLPTIGNVTMFAAPTRISRWVAAFVVASGADLPAISELDAHCRSLIASFKRPKAYFFEDALPKNNYGKVLKTELREKLSRS
ncbi:hypothetical protein [Hoeflea sp.]|uniref:AMP-binding enzyme n=1 Tax=Hoeflea sp. TaxID=1940281 RepID=UPI003747A544